jgi:hypothetical protein
MSMPVSWAELIVVAELASQPDINANLNAAAPTESIDIDLSCLHLLAQIVDHLRVKHEQEVGDDGDRRQQESRGVPDVGRSDSTAKTASNFDLGQCAGQTPGGGTVRGGGAGCS